MAINRQSLITNITGIAGNYKLSIQSADRVELLKSLSEYLASLQIEDVSNLQRELNRKMSDIGSFAALDFDSDLRLGELISLCVLSHTIKELNGLEYLVSWQRKGSKSSMANLTQKESWDGLLLYSPQQGQGEVMPVELKSLMIDPMSKTSSSLNELVEDRCKENAKHFQKTGSAVGLLVLPYAFNGSPDATIDPQKAMSSVKKHAHPDTLKFICYLELPLGGDEKRRMNVKCHIDGNEYGSLINVSGIGL